MTSGQPGASETTYSIFVNDPLGNRLADVSDYASLEGAVAVGTVGALQLILPGDFNPALLVEDNIVEVWRAPLGGRSSLLLDRLWWMRDFHFIGSGPQESHKITCHDQNFIFGSPDGQRGRIVAYDESEPQTAKVDAVDDMMKAYVRENAGSLAADSERDLSTYLSVQADSALGPVGYSSGTSRRVLLSVLNDLAGLAASLGTYVAWDIVCTIPPDTTRSGAKFKLEFRTYIGQRGQDHRASSGNPVLIGPDFNNLESWELVRLTANEANFIYARGEGVGTAAAIATAFDATRLGVSPFNRREYLVDSQAEDADGLADDAESALRANRPRQYLTGTLVPTDQARYGFEFGFGDYLTAQARGQSFDCRLDALSFSYSRDQGETLRPVLRSDDV